MGQRVHKDLMELREKRYNSPAGVNHCVSVRRVLPLQASLLMCCVSQGEMGPEGLRGLAGESGNKGTKVRRTL